MLKKYFKRLFILMMVFLGNMMLVNNVVAAEGGIGKKIIDNLTFTRQSAELPIANDPVVVVGLVIRGLLAIVVIIFFILLIIAGFRWMTAGGNEEAVTSAKKNLKNAIIGLLIVVFAYAITTLVFNIILGNPAP